MSEIIIRDGKVLLCERSITKTVSEEDFLAELQKNAPITIPLMPRGTRGFSSHGSYAGFVVEYPPITRAILHKGESCRTSLEYVLHYPWMYYVVMIQENPLHIQSVSLFYAQEQVTSPSSIIGRIPTPNINVGKGIIRPICLGNVELDNGLLFHECVEKLIEKICTSTSNQDYFTSAYITANEPVFIKDARKKLCTPAKLKSVKHPAAKYNTPGEKYFLAWHQLTASMDIENFLKVFDMTETFTYGAMIDDLNNSLKE